MTRYLNFIRAFRRLFGSFDRFGSTPFHSLATSFELASQGVRYFYLGSALFVWMQIMSWHQMAIAQPPLELVWPILWTASFPMLPLIDVLGLACATSAVLAFWKPRVVLFRAAFALTLLFSMAFPASTGAINHGDHEWFWIAFVFIFLPKATGRSGRLSYCLTFATAQALVLTFYTLAGFWKTVSGFAALLHGAPGNFSPHALAWTLADRMTQTGTQPLLGPFFVENYWLAWPMFLFLIYVQFVSMVVAFRPTLHSAWGLILIVFHTGTFVLMEIAFPTHIFFLMLLLVASPFQRPDWFRLRSLALLPIIGDLAITLTKRRSMQPMPAKPCAT